MIRYKKLMQSALLLVTLTTVAVSSAPVKAQNTPPSDIQVFAPPENQRPEASWSFQQRAEDLSRKDKKCIEDTKLLPPMVDREKNVTNVGYCSMLCQKALREYITLKDHPDPKKLAEMLTPSIQICENYYHGLNSYITENNLKPNKYGVPLAKLKKADNQYIVDDFLNECDKNTRLRQHTCGCAANRVILCLNNSEKTEACKGEGYKGIMTNCR